MSRLYNLICEVADSNLAKSDELSAWLKELEINQNSTYEVEVSDLIDALDYRSYSPSRPTLDGVEITVVERWGGEGEGDDIGFIFRWNEEYVRIRGYYSSWEGVNWDDFPSITEVEPKEVTVTQYVDL